MIFAAANERDEIVGIDGEIEITEDDTSARDQTSWNSKVACLPYSRRMRFRPLRQSSRSDDAVELSCECASAGREWYRRRTARGCSV